jgi:hypothetical protein
MKGKQEDNIENKAVSIRTKNCKKKLMIKKLLYFVCG